MLSWVWKVLIKKKKSDFDKQQVFALKPAQDQQSIPVLKLPVTTGK